MVHTGATQEAPSPDLSGQASKGGMKPYKMNSVRLLRLMLKVMQIKGLRRNLDAINAKAGIKISDNQHPSREFISSAV